PEDEVHSPEDDLLAGIDAAERDYSARRNLAQLPQPIPLGDPIPAQEPPSWLQPAPQMPIPESWEEREERRKREMRDEFIAQQQSQAEFNHAFDRAMQANATFDLTENDRNIIAESVRGQ